MPELPEVEGVRGYLDPLLRGRTVTAVDVPQPKIVAHPSAGELVAALTGRRFAGVGRRAKFLLMQLDNGGTLVLHLRMTGLPLVVPAGTPVEKHTHLILRLDNGSEFRYIDPRRFGRFWLLAAGEEDAFTGMAKLGPEPLGPEFGSAVLSAALAGRRTAVKACLLDQSLVAGIGNIYGDEILFAAGVRPDRPAASLKKAEVSRIARQTVAVLTAAVEKDRLTIDEYQAQHGAELRDAERLNVYGREGEPCLKCGTPIERQTIAQRSSYFCPHCQH